MLAIVMFLEITWLGSLDDAVPRQRPLVYIFFFCVPSFYPCPMSIPQPWDTLHRDAGGPPCVWCGPCPRRILTMLQSLMRAKKVAIACFSIMPIGGYLRSLVPLYFLSWLMLYNRQRNNYLWLKGNQCVPIQPLILIRSCFI